MHPKELTVGELRAVCRDKQFKNYSKKKKDELINEITERFADLSFLTEEYVQSVQGSKNSIKARANPELPPPVRFKTLSMKLMESISSTPYLDELAKLDGDVDLEVIFNMIKDELPGFINSDNLEFIDWKKYVDSKDRMKFMLEYNNEKKNPLKGDYEKAYEKLGKFIYKKEIKEFVSVDATSKNQPVYYRLLKKFKNVIIGNIRDAKRAEKNAIKLDERMKNKHKTRRQRKASNITSESKDGQEGSNSDEANAEEEEEAESNKETEAESDKETEANAEEDEGAESDRIESEADELDELDE